jgi:hypothetical protein
MRLRLGPPTHPPPSASQSQPKAVSRTPTRLGVRLRPPRGRWRSGRWARGQLRLAVHPPGIRVAYVGPGNDASPAVTPVWPDVGRRCRIGTCRQVWASRGWV